MCFSAKVKTPKVDTSKAPEPAPLTAEPTSVDFGGSQDEADTTGNDVSKGGRKSLQVEKSTSASTSIRNKFAGANYGTV